jgi:CHASE3 domain sensor protein
MIELVFYFIAFFLILMGISSLWGVIKYYKTGIRDEPLPP